MKIVIATQEEPFYLPLFFERFLALTTHTIAGAVIGDPFNGAKDWFGVMVNHWRWYGTPAFLRQGVRFAGRTALDRVRPDRSPPYSVRAAMRQAGAPVWPLSSVNDGEFRVRATAESVELFVSVAYPRIVKGATLDVFPRGGINFHLGALPRYRGLNPLFWSLLHNEPASAVTIHRMDRALDNGPILEQEPFPLADLQTLDAAYHRAIAIGPGVLNRAIDDLAAGTAVERPNPEEAGSYFGFPTAADGRAFRKMGKRFW